MARGLKGFWTKSLRHNWPAYSIVLFAFALGLTAGTLGVYKLQAGEVQELSLYLDNFMEAAPFVETKPALALNTVLRNNLFLIAAIYLLGLTIIGIPVILMLIFTRGFTLGFTLVFLGWQKNIQGIILSCAAVLPQNIFFLPALLLGGVASLSFALLLVKRFGNSKIVIWPSFLVYSGFMTILVVLAFLAGFTEVYLTPLLIKLASNFLL
ncbi:MAG: Stage II sporulation protein M [Firmicutes bacterium ADurb.Bin456]|nr:MAG: Stage II sporulation protein M [Firmicutes bacterium ADurb.Bin456]